MNKTAQLKIILGVVLAFVVVLATKMAVDRAMELVPVVEASKTIAARTEITKDMVQQIYVPRSAKHPLAVSTIDDLFKGANPPIAKNEIIGSQQVITPMIVDSNAAKDTGFYIKPGYRGVPVQVDDITSFGGTLRRGDLVDLTAVFPANQPLGTAFSKTMIPNVEVVDVVRDSNDKGRIKVVTVAVTPEQVEMVNFAQTTGKIFLSLVPATSSAASNTPGFVPQTFLQKFNYSVSNIGQ